MIYSTSPFQQFGIYTPPDESVLSEHEFADGETLTGLAHRYYGDWREWRLIADTNDVRDPLSIPSGTTLIIPELPPETGDFDSF